MYLLRDIIFFISFRSLVLILKLDTAFEVFEGFSLGHSYFSSVTFPVFESPIVFKIHVLLHTEQHATSAEKVLQLLDMLWIAGHN